MIVQCRLRLSEGVTMVTYGDSVPGSLWTQEMMGLTGRDQESCRVPPTECFCGQEPGGPGLVDLSPILQVLAQAQHRYA